MSNKSGVSSQVISLPKGGGALHGIGETFAPDLHTGTGNFTVPLALPPGRNGFQPQLSLVYSTGTGNGPFGLGWNLSVPGVSRKTSQGIPRYDDTHDTFLLSGAEDLIPVAGEPPDPIRYQPRTEGLFARIEHHRDVRNDYWEVRSKDGLVSLYGTPGQAGRDPAVIADPADRTNVFAWKLTLTTDPFGNRIEYSYERDAVQTDGPHHWDQLYLSTIRYGDYGDPNPPRFLVTVHFAYENRPDPFSEYRPRFEIRTVRRGVRIDIATDAGVATPVRSYHLLYQDQGELPPAQLPRNGVSLLGEIRVEGYDGERSESLPPLGFGYSRFEPEGRDFFPITGPDLPPGSLARPEYELADLIGNGLPDILEMSGTVRYWRNLGNGRFDRPREMPEAPAGLRLADPGVQLLDANGDGRIDLLVSTPGLAGYFPMRFGGFWDRRSFQPYPAAPSFNLEDPEVRLVDLNGDGVTDAIRSGSRLECFFNDPKAGWRETRWVEREDFPNNFSDPRVKWADLSGDGLQDIVLVANGSVDYWPNRGYGDWGRRVTMRNAPRLPYQHDPRRVLLGDVDGDGLADLVYVDDNKVTLWINQSGNRWSDPIEIRGTPRVTDMDAVRLVDLLGCGIGGILWSSDANVSARQHLFFLDFTGGVKPYLLQEMDNRTGAVTRVGYAPSTRFYLEDEARSATRWRTPLPFPVQVVAQVEVIDQISGGKLATEYRYHHGYWDGAEREFRGFGRVDQRDTETFAAYHAPGLHSAERPFAAVPARVFSPATETRTWFHQGPVGDEFGEWEELDCGEEFWPGDPSALTRPPALAAFLDALLRRAKRDALRALRGRVLRTEFYARDGSEREERPYTVTEAIHGVREESPPSAAEPERPRIFFSFALAERTTQWERGDEPLTRFGFVGDYDAYGQPRAQSSIAVPRGRDFRVATAAAEPYLATFAVTTYAQRDDVEHYLVSRVARTASYEIPNDGRPSVPQLWNAIQTGSAARQLIGQTLNFYDGAAFEGLPFGQIGDYGALVRSESLVLTPDLLREAYGSDAAVSSPAEIPPYLVPAGAATWPAEYPQEFRDRLPALGGYVYRPGGADSASVAGYFVVAARQRYDFHTPGGERRGLVEVLRDPLGRDTTIAYDAPYHLLPVAVTDPVGLKTTARYDYRVLQPSEVTDPNGNKTLFGFSPLGLLEATWVRGKAGEGDRQQPGVRMEYDFFAFAKQGRPIFVRAVRRVHHDTETDIPLPQRDETITTVEYSDGFGRLLQTRAQAEAITFGDSIFGDAGLPADQAAPNRDASGHARCPDGADSVVVSGWQTYDNKGRVVEKYEPFFSCGWEYAAPTTAQLGQKIVMIYDPRGQVIRTVNPDGSEQRVIHGIPVDLDDPDVFVPTPWEAYTYDANDNAGRTHAADPKAKRYQHHWNTPASIVVDALGRTVEAVQRNRAEPQPGAPLPPVAAYRTRSTYDIRGNVLAVTDELGRLALRSVYDLANQPWRTESMDAGMRRVVLDAVGNPIEQRDSKGALVLHTYDRLNRPLQRWARDGAGQALTLRERLLYGDDPAVGLTDSQVQAANLLGKPYQHYDEAGLLTLEAYDFKGNVLEKVRQVIRDEVILQVFEAAAGSNWQVEPYRVYWQPSGGATLAAHAGSLLETTRYCISTTYDALNRVKVLLYPRDVDGKRKTLRPQYNRAGALERVELDGKPYVNNIAYNAKGQRVLIAYGNGVMTRYTYDPVTFRLVRMRTERYKQSG